MQKNKTLLLLTVLGLLLIYFVYTPLFKHSIFYLDDYTSIINEKILLKNFSLQNAINSLFCNQGGVRPLSYLSLYLNSCLIGTAPGDFFIVNFIIHIINFLLVFIFFDSIFKKDKYLSLLIAILWAVTTVNLFAVSYLVQRMTELMTLFGLLSFIFFQKYITSNSKKYLIISIVMALLSTLAKENGILFLPGLFYLGYFQDIFQIKKKQVFWGTVIIGAIFLITTSFYYYDNNFQTRGGITPLTRLFTETRVIFIYLKNLILPSFKELFLYYQITPSTALFKPITTFFSFIILLITFSLIWIIKDKFISMFLFFFLFFQVLEATTIPLLLVFFHRMYLPSIFIYGLIFYLLQTKFNLKNTVYIIVIILITIQSFYTFKTNKLFTQKTQYLKENLKYFPNNPSLLAMLAINAKENKDFETALFYQKEKLKYKPNDILTKKAVLRTMIQARHYKEAAEFAKPHISNPFFKFHFGKVTYILGKKDEGLKIMLEAYKQMPKDKLLVDIFKIYKDLGYFEELVHLFEKAPSKIKHNQKILLMAVYSYLRLHKVEKIPYLFKMMVTSEDKKYLISMYLNEIGKSREALIMAKSIKTKSPFFLLKKQFLISDCYKKLKEYEKAEQVLIELKKQYPAFTKLIDIKINRIYN